jgi:hypothetical protein
MDLYCDLSRRLPATDPFDRQTVIGLGAFAEAAALATTLRGARLRVEPFPDGEAAPRLDTRRIARMTVECESTEPDSLAAMLPLRRTVRHEFSGTPSEASIAAIRRDSSSATLIRVLTEPRGARAPAGAAARRMARRARRPCGHGRNPSTSRASAPKRSPPRPTASACAAP